jgi:uncharacterized protein (DUF4415 family)
MRKNYDLKKLKWKANPYAKLLKKPVTIRLDEDVIEYFRALSESEGVPYQTLMNLFLRYCKDKGLQPETNWKKRSA